ncbi:carbon-nitrogen hydrolase family protein [Microbacterium sp. Kw_RZR3]|uniref:carbon-nitrogen hydrolase family protein n=1 Tax=unclassified Microbacterium TaxID=2609290 RepID=UPI0023DB4EA5|nr:carbon-nitrogen hydrolase family protein [Microbacterium sp. Kw_RZR3]MDF2046971.1 carbon-nitrogen hydrolase family protein [Microbacterium sp. Kw_RZR3]
MTCRIATVQMEAVPNAIDGNVARIARLVEEAAAGGADLVLFPEAAVTGYDDGTFARPLPELADPTWWARLQDAVDHGGVTAIVNTAIQRDGCRFLGNVILSPGRDPLPAYDKQHLYDSERSVFTPGAHGASFTLKGLRFALSVCYDANFPEHAAAAARAGAHVYLNSGAYFPGGEHRRDLHYAARALDNGMYVVFSGLVGAPHDFIGGAAVFDPLGRRITVPGEGEHIAFADLDPDAVDDARQHQRMWAQRRESLGGHEHVGSFDKPGTRL